jgi:hypothetical protein
MVLAGRDVIAEHLKCALALLERRILPQLGEPSIRRAAGCEFAGPHRVRQDARGFEGSSSPKRPRQPVRSRAADRVHGRKDASNPRGQGVRDWSAIPLGRMTYDALIIGYYEGSRLDIRRAHPNRIHAGCAANSCSRKFSG